jgi:hypothetical protein
VDAEPADPVGGTSHECGEGAIGGVRNHILVDTLGWQRSGAQAGRHPRIPAWPVFIAAWPCTCAGRQAAVYLILLGVGLCLDIAGQFLRAVLSLAVMASLGSTAGSAAQAL